jgi:hypothetical protein
VGDEQGRGGLSIGPGDRDQLTRVEPNGELRLADPSHGPLSESFEHWSVQWDSRADHDEAGACHPVEVVSSKLDRDSGGAEIGCTSCSCGIRALIRDIDIPSLSEGQACSGDAADAEADDCDTRSFQALHIPSTTT